MNQKSCECCGITPKPFTLELSNDLPVKNLCIDCGRKLKDSLNKAISDYSKLLHEYEDQEIKNIKQIQKADERKKGCVYKNHRWRTEISEFENEDGTWHYECLIKAERKREKNIEFKINYSSKKSILEKIKETGVFVETDIAFWKIRFHEDETILDHKHKVGFNNWHRQYAINGTSGKAVISSLAYISSHDCRRGGCTSMSIRTLK